VHKRGTALLRSSARVVAIVAVLLITTAAPAAAARTADVDPGAVTFGLLGPVGLVAVALGVLGMVAGVLRQRRKARAENLAVTVAEQADGGLLVEDPTKPVLAPAERTLA
jgi:hypothetical protein